MRMLSGEKLGAALTQAMALKGVGPTEVANHFGIKPPSVKDWQRKGCVHKRHLGKLISYFSDVVPPQHWGVEPMEFNALASALAHPSSEGAPNRTSLGRFEPNQPFLGGSARTIPSMSEFAPIDTSFQIVKTIKRAPVVVWERLGVDLAKENIEWPDAQQRPYVASREVSSRAKFVQIADNSMAPNLMAGDYALFDPDQAPERGKTCLFLFPDGSAVVRRFQPLANGGFEAVDASGHALDSSRHGLIFAGLYVLMQREGE